MSIDEEKSIIYQLMKEIMNERRELSRQYFDLKSKLDQLCQKEHGIPKQIGQPLTIMEREIIKQQDILFNKNKSTPYNSFDRISKNIISLLKQSPVPLSNKQIYNKLTKEYAHTISLKNLTCNILPKMKNERSLSIQKACRGYWKYKRSNIEGSYNQ